LKRRLRRVGHILLSCFALLLLLIIVEAIAGWHCNLQGGIPAPIPQPKDRKAAVSEIKDYSRNEDDAYLSLPEWYIVWSYQEKADFQKDHLPSGFPYFGAVKQYWQQYCCLSRAVHGQYGFNAGEQIMLVVLGTSFSGEYILKGLYEKTLGRLSEWTSGQLPTEEDIYAAQMARDYADFVLLRPFYEYHFARHVKGIWSQTHLWGPHLLRKCERKAFLTLDYTIEAFYSWLIENITHLTYGYESDRTYAWIDNANPAALAQVPQLKLVKQVGPRAFVVDAPRYQPFTPVAVQLARQNVTFLEIAGNSSVTLSVLAVQASGNHHYSAQLLFSAPVLTRPGWQRQVFRCDVSSLSDFLNQTQNDSLVIEHIYDY
jgi:hypothetical protein